MLIEGDTERILIPTIMRKLDLEEENEFLPLLSQNISIIEVGAHSQIFEKFIQFLGIKSLILTDIDSVKQEVQDDKPKACPVNVGTETSNSAIKHFLGQHIKWDDLKILPIEQRTFFEDKICISYQQKESNYHARSFEDAFIHINRDFIDPNIKDFQGLKNKKNFSDGVSDAYKLAEECIAKKTHFALDILYHSDENFSNWQIPAYIKEGLLWLKAD